MHQHKVTMSTKDWVEFCLVQVKAYYCFGRCIGMNRVHAFAGAIPLALKGTLQTYLRR